jgi:hypothetical protein
MMGFLEKVVESGFSGRIHLESQPWIDCADESID